MAKLTQLRTIRMQRGLSQTQLAQQAQIARPYLSQLESGIKSGSIETLKVLAETLGVTTDDLITDIDSVPETASRIDERKPEPN